VAKKAKEPTSSVIGKKGEQLALRFLKRQGYRIVKTNYQTRRGEIDIIARKNNFLVFIEVKTRIGDNLGFPEESVGYFKRKSLAFAASYFLTKEKVKEERYRTDLVSIILDSKMDPVDIRLYQNIDNE